MAETLVIDRVGPKGDGVAEGADGPSFIPYTLPGEVVLAPENGHGPVIAQASLHRIEPICPYFGACGGCKLQHWRLEPYLAWKRGLVVEALRARGVEAPVAATIDAHGAGRRRVTFHARRDGGETRCGFMRAGSHEIIAIEQCPVLAPALAGAPRLAHALADILTRGGKPLDIAITATESGLDASVRGHGPLSEAERDRLVALADEMDLARLANHNEVVVERRRPLLAMGRCQVAPPPGAFLQATAQGEATLARLVAEGVGGKATRIADLFCGVGPLALRLAERAQVLAVDADAEAIAALTRAARATPGLKPVTGAARDLFRRPLLPAELAPYDAVVLDPPRQGARAQVAALARAGVGRIVYVSCDASTFARDAAVLVGAGHRLAEVVPVDQFRWSAHVELVGVFLARR